MSRRDATEQLSSLTRRLALSSDMHPPPHLDHLVKPPVLILVLVPPARSDQRLEHPEDGRPEEAAVRVLAV